jgi:hypothetical protein
MKELTLLVPEEQYDFILELVQKLGVEVAAIETIPEEHKSLVRERILNEPAANYRAWSEAKKALKTK